MNIQPKVYRAKQISQVFGVGLSSVWLMAKEKKITPIHISPKITVFDAKEIHRFFGVEA